MMPGVTHRLFTAGLKVVGRLPLATKDCPVSNTSSLYCRFEGGGQAAVGNQGLSSE